LLERPLEISGLVGGEPSAEGEIAWVGIKGEGTGPTLVEGAEDAEEADSVGEAGSNEEVSATG